MKALVTGSAGFIGRHLMIGLRSSGHETVGLDRRSGEFTDRTLDLSDRRYLSQLASLTADVDVVFHLAARPGVRDPHPDIERLRFRDNVLATRNLLETAPLSVPFVVTSSSSVYGGALQGGTIRACRETDPLAPRGGYASSKVEVERLCEERRRAGGIVGVIRPFTVAGEQQRPDMALAVWADAIRRRRPIRLFGSADRMRDVTDVRDVVRALITLAECRYDGTLNVGTGVGHRLPELAEALLAASALPAPIVVEHASSEEVEATLADTARCEQVLGFVPRTDLSSVASRVWESLVGSYSLGAAAR